MPIVLTSASKNKLLFAIDISCPDNDNVARKHTKLTKYSNLQVEVSLMWQCQILAVPMYVGVAWCMVAGHHYRSSQLAALTENSATRIQSNPAYSHVCCLDSYDGLLIKHL